MPFYKFGSQSKDDFIKSVQMSGTLSIIIPAFNEEKSISGILDKILAVELVGNLLKEIIIVDDHSTDGTAEKIESYILYHPHDNIIHLSHKINQGKGAALHSGIQKATGEYIVVQDADLEYDPEEFNILLKPILEGFADVVYGSRFMGGKPHRIMFFWHSLGNRILTFMSNALTNLNLTDMETCYKMWKKDIIKSVKLSEKRFGFEPEVTAKVSRIPGVRIYEVGISYYGRTYADGKKINWKDGFRAIYCILKYNMWSKK